MNNCHAALNTSGLLLLRVRASKLFARAEGREGTAGAAGAAASEDSGRVHFDRLDDGLCQEKNLQDQTCDQRSLAVRGDPKTMTRFPFLQSSLPFSPSARFRRSAHIDFTSPRSPLHSFALSSRGLFAPFFFLLSPLPISAPHSLRFLNSLTLLYSHTPTQARQVFLNH